MAFRVRTNVFGRCVLQVSEGDHWIDAKPTESLYKPFSIVSPETLKEMTDRVTKANKRAEILRKSRAKKKAETTGVMLTR